MGTASRRLTLLSLLVTLPLLAAAAGDDRLPKSPKAREAIRRRDRAVEQADAAHRRAVADANKAMVADLKKARDAALTAKNLPEANAIDALIQSAAAPEPGSAGTGEPPLKLNTPKHVLGAWQLSLATGGPVRTIYLRSDHLATHEEKGVIGLWTADDKQLSITWNSRVTDSFELGDAGAKVLSGSNSVGSALRLARK